MSLLAHQSAVNPTVNFWGNGGGSPVPVPYQESSASANINTTIGDGLEYKPISITIADSPLDIVYVVSVFYNLNSDGADSFPFLLGVQYNGGNQFAIEADFKSGKGWATSSFTQSYNIIPNSGAITLETYINNTTGGDLAVNGTVNWSVIAYPL